MDGPGPSSQQAVIECGTGSRKWAAEVSTYVVRRFLMLSVGSNILLDVNCSSDPYDRRENTTWAF